MDRMLQDLMEPTLSAIMPEVAPEPTRASSGNTHDDAKGAGIRTLDGPSGPKG